MRKKLVPLLLIALVVLMGLILASFGSEETIIRSLILLDLITIGLLLMVYAYSTATTSSYEADAQELFQETHEEILNIIKASYSIHDKKLRQKLNLICDDTLVLLEKVAEKTPESRISTVMFIRGNLDFILYDILPQYIEMQDTPRYYQRPDKKMAQGYEAITIYANFLHNKIVALEVVDDIRYEVAIEMLKALNVYSERGQANSNTRLHSQTRRAS